MKSESFFILLFLSILLLAFSFLLLLKTTFIPEPNKEKYEIIYIENMPCIKYGMEGLTCDWSKWKVE